MLKKSLLDDDVEQGHDSNAVGNPLLDSEDLRNNSSSYGAISDKNAEVYTGGTYVIAPFKLNATMLFLLLGLMAAIIYLVVQTIAAEQYGNGVYAAPIVMTTAGPVQGFSYDYMDKYRPDVASTQMVAWRGIPFADPPIGELRWRAPVSPQSWASESSFGAPPLQCEQFKQPCVQASYDISSSILDEGIGVGEEQPLPTGGEDCLYLNVYSNRNAAIEYAGVVEEPSAADLFPVLFYIYGGGLQTGQANGDFDNLVSAFANTVDSDGTDSGLAGLVVVEVSYRLNIFGFLATEELSQESNTTGSAYSGNYGIQDQIKALTWVQENIRSFGGDPNRVTLAGQSSGGTSIFALLAAEKNITTGLFTGAVAMSGSTNVTMALSTAEKQNKQLPQQANCSSTSGPGGSSNYSAVMQCMRALSVPALTSLIPAAWNVPGIWDLPLGQGGQHYDGLVIVDGHTIKQPFYSALGSGSGVDVPLILGNAQCESDEGPGQVVTGYNETQWEQLLNRIFGPWTANSPHFDPFNDKNKGASIDFHNFTSTGLSISERMKQLYPYVNVSSSGNSSFNPQFSFDEIVSDYGLFCGQIGIAKRAKLVEVGNANVGQYRSNVFLYQNALPLEKAYVSPWTDSVVQFAFHDLTGQWAAIGNGSYVPTSGDLQNSRYIQSLWVQFLRNSSSPVLKPVGPDGNYDIAGEWNAVDSAPGWANTPSSDVYSNYSIYRLAPQYVGGVAGAGTGRMVLDLKKDVCDYFKGIGLDREVYWWAN